MLQVDHETGRVHQHEQAMAAGAGKSGDPRADGLEVAGLLELGQGREPGRE